MVEFRTPEELQAHYAQIRKRIEQRGRAAAITKAPVQIEKAPPEPTVAPALALPPMPAITIAIKAQKPVYGPVIRKERRSKKPTPPVIIDSGMAIPRLMWADVVKAVLEYTGLTLPVLFSSRRKQELCHARFLVWTLAYDFCPHLSMPQIGRMSGHKDHTTILHGVRQGPKLPAYEPLYQYLSLLAEERLQKKMASEEATEEFEGAGVA
jgi:hypothetical protein